MVDEQAAPAAGLAGLFEEGDDGEAIGIGGQAREGCGLILGLVMC